MAQEEDEGYGPLDDRSPFWFRVFDRDILHHRHHLFDDEGEGVDEEDDDGGEEGELGIYQYHRNLDRNMFSPVFPHDYPIPDPRFSRSAPSDSVEVVDPLEFRVFDGVVEMGSDHLDLDLGMGLLGIEKQDCYYGDDIEDDDGGDRGDCLDWGLNGFFVGRRGVAAEPGGGGSSSSGGAGGGEDCLRIVGFESESDFEDEQTTVLGANSDRIDASGRTAGDLDLPLCWDCLRIEEDRRDLNEEFEWEEVNDRVDERDVLRGSINPEQERSNVQVVEPLEAQIEDDEEEEEVRNIEWEVLLAVNNLNENPSMDYEDADSYAGDLHGDFIHNSEYEILFGQFVDDESAIKGSPPAAKSVVKNLTSVVFTKEDLEKKDTLCAVCKDDIPVGVSAKQLPCLHYYHEECILPWLEMRNTCPVCRYELPTDDPDYENCKARRAGDSRTREESQFRYTFEMFPED